MAIILYRKTILTGGTSDALDGIDGSVLNDGDECRVYTSSNILYFYRLDATSGATEDSPDIIAPDNNPGSKRWILQDTTAPALHYADLTGFW